MMRKRLFPLFMAALCLLAQLPAQAKSQRKLVDCPAGVSVFLSDSNWPREGCSSFLPYVDVKVCVRLDRDAVSKLNDDRLWKVRLSDKSKLNGKALPKEALDYRGHSSTGDDKGITLVLAQDSGQSVLPNDPGKYTLELVLDTPTGLWKAPPIKAEVAVSKDAAGAYADFKKLKCDAFLTHPHGLRPGKSDDGFCCSFSSGSREYKQFQRALKKNIPYSSVVQFVAKHPDSTYIDQIHEKAVRSWENDLWRGEDDHKDTDKKALAQLLAIFEDNPVEFCENQLQDAQRDLDAASGQWDRKWRKSRVDNIETWVKILGKELKDPETMALHEQVKAEREKNPERFKYSRSGRCGYVRAPEPRPQADGGEEKAQGKKKSGSDSLDGLLKD